jgi:DNA-binding NtrC family response regulator
MPTQSLLKGKFTLLLTDIDRLSRTVEQIVSKMGGFIEIVAHTSTASSRLLKNQYDIVLLSEPLIDDTLTNWLQENSRQQPVLLLSDCRDPEQLLNWIHYGIADLIPSSLSGEQLHQAIVQAALPANQRPVQPSRKKIRDNHPFYGKNPLISALLDQIEKIAPRAAPILLEGETGTGKSFFARKVHDLSRRKGRLVSINCATFSPNLLESELFGHAKGAFTGAEAARAGLTATAENGTLFLDEIGELPTELQPKLLQLLEDKMIRPVGSDIEQPVTARIVAATNCDLKQRVKEGKFRADLYYRLNVIPLKLPSLRDRPDDIPGLVNSFIEELCEEHNLTNLPLSDAAMSALKQGTWSGNVRELRNHLERALLLNLPFEQGIDHHKSEQPETQTESGWQRLEEHEKSHILLALDKSDGNKSQAALLLGISRRTLERKLKRWGSEVA